MTERKKVTLPALYKKYQDGDLITVDIPNRSLHLHVSDEDIRSRLSRWKKPEPKFSKGYLALYGRLAESADKGAIIRHKF